MTTQAIEERPALYCGTYGKYNDGSIAGKWLYLDDYEDGEAFLKACAELHKDEQDPEFMFQDFEYLPRCLYSESLSRQDLEQIYAWLALDADNREIVGEYLDEVDSSTDIDNIMDYYQGNINDYKEGFMSNETAYGWYVIENGLFGVEIPDALQNYIDVEAIGRDYLMDIDVTESGYMFYRG